MKYQADSIEFMLPGLPEQVKAITGVSGVEEWGRWSDANLAPAVDIDYVDPLPKTFDLVLRARAYGNNVGEPISVRVGDEERFVSLGEQDSTVTPALRQPARRAEDQHYPAGADRAERERQRRLYAEKLGIGLVSLKVEAASPPPDPHAFTGAVFSLPRPSFRPSFTPFFRLTCDGKTPQPATEPGHPRRKYELCPTSQRPQRRSGTRSTGSPI